MKIGWPMLVGWILILNYDDLESMCQSSFGKLINYEERFQVLTEFSLKRNLSFRQYLREAEIKVRLMYETDKAEMRERIAMPLIIRRKGKLF